MGVLIGSISVKFDLIQILVFWSDPNPGIVVGSRSKSFGLFRIWVFWSDPDPSISFDQDLGILDTDSDILVGSGSKCFVHKETSFYLIYGSGSGYFVRIKIRFPKVIISNFLTSF